jgi:ketosteroid isomerase-like protein
MLEAVSESEVLASNEAFYDAFNSRDMDAMDRLWAKLAPVVCLHPGSTALHGRTQVIRSWQSILSSDGAPRVSVEGSRVVMLGQVDGSGAGAPMAAMVLCYERVTDPDTGTGAVLAATNVFVREGGEWRLVHHHSSAIGRIVTDESEARTHARPSRPKTLN